ncbi:MAG: hypothetical protein U0838_10115 [Chloroflexota bacterium]
MPAIAAASMVVVLAVAAVSMLSSGLGIGTGLGQGSRPGGEASSGAAVSPQPSQSGAASDGIALGSRFEVADGITLRAPEGWTVTLPGADISGGGAMAVMANFDLAKRCTGRPNLLACAASVHLGRGEIIATLSSDETPMRIEDIVVPDAVAQHIDGMLAVLQLVEAPAGTQITGVAVPPGCDAHRAWWITRPDHATGWLDVEACSADADRGVFRSAVDGLAQSIQFP